MKLHLNVIVISFLAASTSLIYVTCSANDTLLSNDTEREKKGNNDKNIYMQTMHHITHHGLTNCTVCFLHLPAHYPCFILISFQHIFHCSISKFGMHLDNDLKQVSVKSTNII